MAINWKEAAKFFAGFSTHAMLFHGVLAMSQSLNLFYHQLTNFYLNVLAVFFWSCLIIASAYYGWLKK